MFTAENIYLYMFLVGFLFSVANIVISGLSHFFGHFGGPDSGIEGSSVDSHELDSGDFGSHELPGSDYGGDFGSHELTGGHFESNFDGNSAGDFGDSSFGDANFGDGHFGDSDLGDLQIDHTSIGELGHAGHDFTVSDVGTDVHATNFDGNTQIDAHTHGDMQLDTHSFSILHLYSSLSTYLPLRPSALICFFTIAGGLGSIGIRLDWNRLVTHLAAIISGYALSMLIGVALPGKLRKSQSTSAAEQNELIGLKALVVSTILENGYGRISFVVRDNTLSAPAKHIDGHRVSQGAQVVICKIHRQTFYVFIPDHLIADKEDNLDNT